MITVGDEQFEPTHAFGPDRQRVAMTRGATVPVEVYAEDGITLLGRSAAATFTPGHAYSVALE